ncbi:hypothetical protein SAMN06295920_10479 [Rhizorhabdus histidinilytica]|uniref:Uncharacterized protein n=1 Tax=Rhizorhabdus histidinilytica TaxID=439228 RepID=A0A1T5CI14_9SPHN|nr:hypothetical protein SAMN06295920_10479 [Rhizorhabdus histidinilytica]
MISGLIAGIAAFAGLGGDIKLRVVLEHNRNVAPAIITRSANPSNYQFDTFLCHVIFLRYCIRIFDTSNNNKPILTTRDRIKIGGAYRICVPDNMAVLDYRASKSSIDCRYVREILRDWFSRFYPSHRNHDARAHGRSLTEIDKWNLNHFRSVGIGIESEFNSSGVHVSSQPQVGFILGMFGRFFSRNGIAASDCQGILSTSGRLLGSKHSLTRVMESGEQSNEAANGDPETPLCPKCAIFGGLSRAPLGAKIAFVVPIWLMAWLAIFDGFNRRRLLWIAGGIAIFGIPLLLGVI